MPSKKKKSKNKRAKSKTKRVKVAPRAKRAGKAGLAKRVVKKKQAKKKTGKSRVVRSRSSLVVDARRFESGQDKSDQFSGEQSGDLQGLSRAEEVDSESVDELAEEGNLFEAGAVAGVEEADNSDEKEVHTHEVPEDDVPGEYLDNDE